DLLDLRAIQIRDERVNRLRGTTDGRIVRRHMFERLLGGEYARLLEEFAHGCFHWLFVFIDHPCGEFERSELVRRNLEWLRSGSIHGRLDRRASVLVLRQRTQQADVVDEYDRSALPTYRKHDDRVAAMQHVLSKGNA